MASLIVRNLEDTLIDKLKIRAARNRRSAEAEHREILRQVLSGERHPSFKALAAKVRAMTAGRNLTASGKMLREGRNER
jgi:antitoxin FitA